MPHDQSVLRRLDLYGQVSPRADERDAALARDELETRLALGVEVFRSLCASEKAARLRGNGGGEWGEFAREIKGLVRLWADLSNGCVFELENFESLGIAVAGAEAFQRCCREARSILSGSPECPRSDRTAAPRGVPPDRKGGVSTAFRPQVKEAAGAPEAAYPVFVVRPSKAGRPWTPEEDALLGTMPNAEVARRTGRTLSAVEQRRSYLRHRGRKD